MREKYEINQSADGTVMPNFYQWADTLIKMKVTDQNLPVMKPIEVASALQQAFDQGIAFGVRQSVAGYTGVF